MVTSSAMMLPLASLSIRQLTDVESPPASPRNEGLTARTKGRYNMGGAKKSGRRRPQDLSVPTHGRVAKGWGHLLDEVSASSRRVRVAAGGGFCQSAREARRATASPALLADAEVMEDMPPGTARTDDGVDDAMPCWQSYAIDESKVPDSVLSTIWKKAVDPKHCLEKLVPLDRFPRLTVTKRDVEALPAVHDYQHWRTLKEKRRATRKAKAESERFPTLAEMMKTMFGEDAPTFFPFAHLKSPIDQPVKPATYGDTLVDAGILKPRRAVVALEAFKEPPAQDYMKGVLRLGRRAAFDEGLPSARANGPMLIEVATARALQKSNLSRTSRAFENMSRAAAFETDREGVEECRELIAEVKRVNKTCQHRLKRVHSRFVKRQEVLSERLQHRVQRIRTDAEEIRDAKVGSILPSVFPGGEAAGQHATSPGAFAQGQPADAVAQRGVTVLRYLQKHRRQAERARQSRHLVYLRQVELFQGYLRLVADPNRPPERGEVYLSESFRHVLAAGLVVDQNYFFRVLGLLEPEDFQLAPTVNFLAACCATFDIDLGLYRSFLKQSDLPFLAPRTNPAGVRAWEDWAPWNGVVLRDDDQADDQDGDVGAGEAHLCSDYDLPTMQDPLPFAPIMPHETPATSALISRSDDLLAKILSEVAMDAVLERYDIKPCERRPSSRQGTSELPEAGSPVPTDDLSLTIEPSAPEVSTPRVKAPPLTPRNAKTVAARVATQRTRSTLQKARGSAEPMSEMRRVPSHGKPPMNRMVAIAERQPGAAE